MNQLDCKVKKIGSVCRVLCVFLFIFFAKTLQGFGSALLEVGLLSAVLLLVFYSDKVSDILGNMHMKRRKKGQFFNVLLIRRTMPVTMVFFAIIFGLLFFFGAEKIAHFFKIEYSKAIIQCIAPIFLIMALRTSIEAYFKGNGQYLPIMLGEFIRPIGLLIAGPIFLKKGSSYGDKVAQFLLSEEKAFIYIAMAMTISILVVETVILLIEGFLYIGSDRNKDRRKSKAGTKLNEGYFDIVRNFFIQAYPSILSGILLVVSILLGMKKLIGMGTVEEVASLGGFMFAFFMLPMVMFLLLKEKAYELGYKLMNAKKIQEAKRVKHSTEITSMFSFRIGIYLTILGLVLIPYLLQGLFGQFTGISSEIAQIGALSILPIVVSIVSLSIMRADGKTGASFLVTAIALVVECSLMEVLPGGMEQAQKGFAYAFLGGMVLLMVLSFGYLAIRQYYQVNVVYTLIIPLISGAITGLFLILGLKLISPHIGAAATIIIGTILCTIIYFGILSAVKNVTSHETKYLYEPGTQKILGLFIK